MKRTQRRRVVVALSGGADSTALLHALAEWGRAASCEVHAAYFAHNIRDAESQSQELRSVRASCRRAGVALMIGEAAPGEIALLARQESSAVEAAARKLRYRFLKRAALASGASIVCTAHTRNDQVESIAISRRRGVDPLFTSGIPQQRDLGDGVTVVRPLLRVRRRSLLSYLKDNGCTWFEDPSNDNLHYERNRVRHLDLPRARATDPELDETLLSMQRNSARERRAAEDEARQLTWHVEGEVSQADLRAFLRLRRGARLVALFQEARRRSMIRASSRIQVRFFAPLLGDCLEPGVIIAGRGQRIRVENGRLIWSPDIVRASEYGYLRRVILGVAVELQTGPALIVRGEKASTDDRPSVIELKEAHEPLVVRSLRAGDRLSMVEGEKSVRDLLASLSVPVEQRARTSVLLDRYGVVAVLLPDGRVVGAGDRNTRGGESYALEFIGVKADA